MFTSWKSIAYDRQKRKSKLTLLFSLSHQCNVLVTNTVGWLFVKAEE